MSGVGEVISAPAQEHRFAFRGNGRDYFRIWIVNLALTLVTLGVYSAWAKVRARRYLLGSTELAGHNFDYHANPVRILIGRAIALALFIFYIVSIQLLPTYQSIAVPMIIVWAIVLILFLPWLAVSSLRFNARNTSYRNLRFDFTATKRDAFKTYLLWPLLFILSLGTLWPLARRQQDYFYTNHHAYGGRSFYTQFEGWDIYKICLLAVGLFVLFIILFFLWMLLFIGLVSAAGLGSAFETTAPTHAKILSFVLIYAAMAPFYFVMAVLFTAIRAKLRNLSLNHTDFDGRFDLVSRINPWKYGRIYAANLLLTLITVGLYYPFGQVRLRHYTCENLILTGKGDLDAYSSEAKPATSAIGEELGSVFDFDFGL